MKAMWLGKQGHKIFFQANYLVRITIVCSTLLMFGCESNKQVECENIFLIAQDVNQSNQNLKDLDNEQSESMKSWLQAANNFSQAADRLKTLKIDRSESIQYQDRLAHIYRFYARTTHDAVRARENKDLSALKSARSDAVKAGILQRQLIQEINAYCL